MFLQIHTLTTYHATLLNRDDAGLAKRIPFGNAIRLRVSSQCLKRHWTQALRGNLDLPSGYRTRHFFSKVLLNRLQSEGKVEENLARILIKTLANDLMKSAAGKQSVADDLELKQPVLFGKPETDYLLSLLIECAGEKDENSCVNKLREDIKGLKKNFKAMLKATGHGDLYAGIEGALFGRFVTSDLLSRSDAPVHVAHSFSVHRLDTEVDFFTAVEDLADEGETGAGHAGDMEIGAGTFYGYVAIDLPLVFSNFFGCNPKDWREQDADSVNPVLDSLIRIIATVSPGAKRGATAPYSYSDLVLLEAGTQQPRSLANAFLQALPSEGDIVQGAIDALAGHLQRMDSMYGGTADERVVATTGNWPVGPAAQPLAEATRKILKTIA